jgi:hypothetical protein
MRHKIPALFLVLALTVGAVAQQAQPVRSDAPSQQRLREMVTYLASDKLDGRRTGTDGASAAAGYIANEMKRIGLKSPVFPVNTTGAKPPGLQPIDSAVLAMMPLYMLERRDYAQFFPYVAGVELGKSNALFFTIGNGKGNKLVAGTDWQPLGFSSSLEIKNASIVFAGFGLNVPGKMNSYAEGDDVKGKVALVMSGTPDGNNPHGEYANYSDARWKAVAAKDKGAIALMIIASEKNLADDPLSRLRYDNLSGDAGLPVIVISPQVAADIVRPTFPDISGDQTGTDVGEQIFAHARVDPSGPGPLQLDSVHLSLTTDVVRKNMPAMNIIGVLGGSDPNLKKEAIVIGAHYDHLGRGGDGSLAPRSGEVHHGADDNASGVAGLLELARIFAAHKKELRRTIVFIAFSGEEEGLIGSSYYVNHPVFPLAQTVAMINLDMIGRVKDGKLAVGGVGTATDFRSLVTSTNIVKDLVQKGKGGAPDEYTAHDLFNLSLNDDGFGPSDHSSFYGKQVPVLFLFTGAHDDYHKPSDTADKINYEGQANVVGYVRDLIWSIDRNAARPVYAVAKSATPSGGTPGFRVYLGTIPNYADSNDGLLLDGVRDDSPAAKAGLLAGDKVIKIGAREIKNVYDYTYALGEMKAGETYDVVVLRGGQSLTLKIVPAARK